MNVNPKLYALLQSHTNGLAGDIAPLTQLADRNFERDLYPLWKQVDQRICGPGLQFASWRDGQLAGYPNTLEFECITRPLVYVMHSLWDIGTPFLKTRSIVFFIGAHLEGCVKDIHGVTGINQTVLPTNPGRRPLDRLVKSRQVEKLLGKNLCDDITCFCQLLWNPAKHDYFNQGSPDPKIPFADAVAGYFLARALGAKVLRASNRLEPVMHVIRNEHE